jgi:hypothetical protein
MITQQIDDLSKSPRSFPEDFVLENGNYLCSCRTCAQLFLGHKHRGTCKLCLCCAPGRSAFAPGNYSCDDTLTTLHAKLNA